MFLARIPAVGTGAALCSIVLVAGRAARTRQRAVQELRARSERQLQVLNSKVYDVITM
jgi:hypothetical protein